MTKEKAFTIIELLVVIAIISLLMAILTPALNKARDQGRKVVCLNHIRQLGIANESYANECDGWFVPVIDGTVQNSSFGNNSVSNKAYSWVENPTFRTIMRFDEKVSFNNLFKSVLPQEYLCPSDLLGQRNIISLYNTLLSYGYNCTDWGIPKSWYPVPFNFYAGHRASKVLKPAGKLAFIDSNDWFALWRSADYKKGWDRLGQAPVEDYYINGLQAPTLYRHNEGANICFYDGHVEWMAKEKIYH